MNEITTDAMHHVSSRTGGSKKIHWGIPHSHWTVCHPVLWSHQRTSSSHRLRASASLLFRWRRHREMSRQDPCRAWNASVSPECEHQPRSCEHGVERYPYGDQHCSARLLAWEAWWCDMLSTGFLHKLARRDVPAMVVYSSVLYAPGKTCSAHSQSSRSGLGRS